ncbi:MAG: SagB/ThcOx family dehydrogenase [Candidatus Omnitrophica bacterium]|nr:SagB/ThcOx family dehydrogenase [Candidatus Omnitrophota bacterium]
MKKTIPIMIAAMLLTVTAFAQEAKTIQLPKPNMSGGKPLMQALKERKSVREFSSKELTPQVLSDMLWAANGINRPELGYRTAPSAHNAQEIDIYAVLSDGLYLFDALAHELKLIASGDLRGLTGKQPFVKEAAVNLIYVATLSKLGNASSEDAAFYAATDAGFVSENVYLYCASAGLATVVRGWVDKTALGKVMKLRPDQKVILAQTVGYPK